MGSAVIRGRYARRSLLPALLVASVAWPGGAQEIGFSVTNADDDLRDALRQSSLVLEAERNGTDSAQDLFAAARAEYGRLIGTLYANARYSGSIHVLVDGREAAEISPLRAPDRIRRITVRVDPGPVFDFARARVAPLAAGTALPEGFAPGRPAESPVIEDAASAGVTGWRERGHAKADIAGQQVVADHRANTVDADIRLAPGPRLRFGDLVVSGNRTVRTARIEEIAGLPTGTVFSPEALERSTTRLRRTGVFRSVALREEDTVGPDGRLDIDAQFVEQKPRRIGFGAEINSAEGASLSAFWLHRNLLGGAERLRLDGEIGGIAGDSGGTDYSLGARFDRPATFTPDTSLFLESTIQRLDEPDYTSDEVEIGGGLTRIFTPELTGEAAAYLSFSQVEDDLGSRNFTVLRFPVSITRDTRDSELDATEGTYLSAEVTPFAGFNDAESGGRLYADARAYTGFDIGPGDGVVLAGRVQAGSVVGSSIGATRPEMLFFSGGAGTVRGQPYQSLAVELSGDRRVGGRSFLGLSGEVRVGVTDKIGLVGFVDAGTVGRDSTPGDGDMHAGAGIGLRYGTPVGPIRLDVAGPVSGDTGEGAQIYVGIGQAF